MSFCCPGAVLQWLLGSEGALELIPSLGHRGLTCSLDCRLISRDPVTKVLLLEREWEGDVMAGKNPKVVEGRGAWVLLRAGGCRASS